MNDQDLLREFVENKTDAAFAELVRRHQNMVYSTCLRRLEEPQLAQDAAQQTFLRLVHKGTSLLHHPCLGGWLYKTAFLEAGALMKKEANRHKYEQAMSQQALNNEPLPPDERLADLDEALLELKEADRNPLVLRFFEGRNFKEVGQALGATEEAARKRVSRALEALASRMRGRGVTACTVAGLTTMLAHSTHAAPVQLLPAVSTAARQTLSVMDAVGRTAVKAKIALLCTMVAAVPLGVQWQSNRSLKAENVNLRQQLMDVRATGKPPEMLPARVEKERSSPTADAPKPTPMNALEEAIAALLNSEANQLDDSRQARLTERLNLTDTQQREAARLLAAARQRRALGIGQLARGQVTLGSLKDVLQADFQAATEFRPLLTPEQLPAYDQFLLVEKADYTEGRANTELNRLHTLLSLTEAQKEAAFHLLTKQMPDLETLAVDDFPTMEALKERWNALDQQEAASMESILDERQLAVYTQQSATRRAFLDWLLTPRADPAAPDHQPLPPVVYHGVSVTDAAPVAIPMAGIKATVLIFSSTTYPIASGFAPELIRIDQEFRPQGIQLVLVQTEADITPEKARQHASDFQLTFPVLADPTRTLVSAAGATVTPEAVVISPAGTVLYRGRIDDRFAEVGCRWSEPTHFELRDSLTAILANKPITIPKTKVAGCFIE